MKKKWGVVLLLLVCLSALYIFCGRRLYVKHAPQCDIKEKVHYDEYRVTFAGPKSKKGNNKAYDPLGSKGINPSHSRPTVEPKGKL